MSTPACSYKSVGKPEGGGNGVEDGVRLGGLRLLARGRLRAGMYCSRHSNE